MPASFSQPFVSSIMDTRGFLKRVLPDDGTYILMVTGNRGVSHSCTTDVDVLAERAQEADDLNRDVYFAVASFNSTKRTQVGVKWVRSLFIDLDCGPNKEYKSKGRAVADVKQFVKDTGLPTPVVIDSGNGVHCYWPFTESVTREDWEPVAEMLKAACTKYDLRADPAVTADSARVLRVPGSHNYKDPDNPKSVEIKAAGKRTDFADLKSIFESLDLPKPKRFNKPQGERSAVTKALIGNTESNFGKIMRKSLKGTGCNFLRQCVKSRDSLEEPHWRAALSIAWACEDGEDAIQKLSKGHPGYSAEKTLKKAADTKGPYTCETINGLAPGACDECPQRITSPIQLGSQLRRSLGNKAVSEPLFSSEQESIEKPPAPENVEAGKDISYNPPYPYKRGPDRGIYLAIRADDGETDEEVVYENDFYPTQLIDDPNDGVMAVFRLHLPKDGVKEFNVPLSDIASPDRFRNSVSKVGMVANAKQMGRVMEYSIRYIKELQEKSMASKAHMQFGWAERDSLFIIGNRAYDRSGKYKTVPASSATGSLMPALQPMGTLANWKKAINSLAVPGLEPLQFAALAGFGAPLIKFSGVLGGTLNLLSNESGTGKTTAGRIALSIYGHPDDLIVIPKDTTLWKDHRLGVMNNLPVVYDEMTNIDEKDLSDLIYSTPTGRGKNRMESDRNAERVNATSWSTIVQTNSNSSMVSKLAKHKARADGELMRLLELEVPKVTIPNGHEVFELIKTNHGVAGEIYGSWIARNQNMITELVTKKKQMLYDTVKIDQSERFWLGMVASVLAGAEIARRLQLHDLDVAHLEAWICGEFGTQRENTEDSVVSADSLIGEFLLQNSNAILGVSGKPNPMTGTNVFKEPRGREVVARFEAEEGLMFIARKAFKDYCVDRQFTMKTALAQTKQPGSPYMYKGDTKKRMMTGTGVSTPPVNAIVFQCSDDEAEALQEQLLVNAPVED